ncbi:MAG: Rrf2 family transcriptional regulator [Acidobacteria bacterium]|nr:Rrf2 family transcriptional regulator [Acidobacteriota bacterium]
MRISKKGEYGLAAVLYIASKPPGRRILRDEIARHCGIPRNFLARILCHLRDAGILGAVRGANGGYFLREEPARLTLVDLLEALEGPLCFCRCSAPAPGDCPKAWTCSAREAFALIQNRTREWLEGIKVADLLPRQGMCLPEQQTVKLVS